MTNLTNTHPFETLQPGFILDAIESIGFNCDGRVTALNSYENRVYQIGIEDSEPLIVKFYRPDRWSDEQIKEEHEFTYQLAHAELPVVTALKNNQQCLFEYENFRFALYPRKGGRAPELDNPDNLFILGRFLGRMHIIGASQKFAFRPKIDSHTFGHQSVQFISENFIPNDLKVAYDSLARDLLTSIDQQLENYGQIEYIRVHGDCHIGNMLWRDELPHFIDFDDSRMAPAIQDIWMLLSGNRHEQEIQLREILEGYNEFSEFDERELALIEVLRTLRILHFSAWLARRWDDPAFPLGFPWFNTQRYWEEHVLNLREQLSTLQEPVLNISY
ncbi:MAG: serine/threonine protein kinase [Pseudomonadota bacterium]